MFKPGEKPRWILAVAVTLLYYTLLPVYLVADKFVNWFERWDISTFGW
jgi:hypothetical protein